MTYRRSRAMGRLASFPPPVAPKSRVGAGSHSPSGSIGAGYLTYLFLLFYLVAKPFYFNDSGLPQLADLFAVPLFLLTALLRERMPREFMSFYLAGILFCAYALLISGTHFLYLDDVRTGKAGVFYAYNIGMLYVVLSQGRNGKQFLKLFMAFILISCLLQVLLSVIVGSESKRETIFFNNPNQLAYWGLLSAAMFCVCSRCIRVPIPMQVAAWLMFSYLVLLGLSKAATISLIVLAVIHFSRNAKHTVLVTTVAVLVLVLAEGVELLENAGTRLASIGEQSDDSILGRGYDRILAYPQYLLFGAGEYGLARFPGADHEIHSTIGTVVFSYGFVGTLVFGTFLWLLFRLAGFSISIYLLPIFLYGGVHNGLRFTLLWMLFGLVAVVGRVGKANAKRGIEHERTEDMKGEKIIGAAASVSSLPDAVDRPRSFKTLAGPKGRVREAQALHILSYPPGRGSMPRGHPRNFESLGDRRRTSE